MTDPKDRPPDFNDLRRRAEALLAAEAILPEELSPAQAASLIHELRVHQIELEMQNDELRLSQARLEESRSRYADLYDFAPVGYLTLDGQDRIVEANLTATTLLGVERSKLLNRFFPHFLPDADRRVLRQLLNNGLNQRERRGEFHLKDGHGDLRVMLLDILFLQDAEGHELRRITLTDITELKHAQEELRLHKEELEELVAERTAELLQANEQLREANGQLEALFQAAPLAIAVFDAEGKVTNINPAAERLYGWSLEEVQGRLPLSIPQESPEESLTLLQRVLQGESVTGVEIKQQRQDGTLLDGSVSAAPLHDANGKLRGFIGLAEDITQRKQAEEALHTQALVLSNMAEGVAVTDQGGHIMYTNPALDAMFEYEPGELLGRHSNILNFDPPEKNRPLEGMLYQVNTTGSWTGEFRNCRKNGKPFFTHAHISMLTLGQKKLYVSVQEDITARRRTREMFKRQAELLDLARDAILVQDLRGRISYWNRGAEELYGWKSSEAMAKVVHQLLATEFPESLKSIETLVFETGYWEGELIHTTRDGRRVIVDSRWSLKRDDAGKPLAILEINHDITARKASQAAVEESEARYRTLVELSPDAILVHAQGRYLYANQASLKLFGATTPQEIIGQRVLDLVHPDSQAIVKRRVTAGKRLDLREIKILRLDGQMVEVEVAATPMDYYGQPGVQVVLRDVTERRQAELEIRRMASFPELNPHPVLEVDQKGRVHYANPAARHIAEKLGLTEGVKAFLPPDLKELFAKARHGGPREYSFDLPLQDVVYAVTLSFPHDLPTARLYALDITKRKRTEAALRRAHDELEQQVAKRTASLRLANEQLLWEIAERQRVQDRLQESEARFTAFMEHLPGLAVMRDMQGRYLFANQAWEKMMDLEPGAWQGKTLAELWPPEQAAALQQLDFEIISSGKPAEWVEISELVDGPHHFLTKRFPITDSKGLPYMVGNIAIDITARQRAEQRAVELGRLYRVLSQVNEAILRGRDQESLFLQICHIAVEEGLFRMAWVGLTDPLGQMIQVAAKYGSYEGYLDNMVIPVADGPESQGPTGTSVREDRYDICNDLATDPRMAPWREKALDRGYRASGAFPLRIGKRVVGALTLYASRPGFFTDQEITLLTSLADNLSFALESLDRESRRRQAEEALRGSEKKLRYLAEQLLTAQENERKRLAAELHDELGHALLALKLHLSSIEKKLPPEQEAIKEEILAQLNYINEVIQDVRRLYHDLSPGDLEDLGLTKALRALISDFASHVPQITWQVDLVDLEGLFSLPVQTIIYRIMQEALTNIGKHAHPTLVSITAKKEKNRVHFVVQDNGQGFDSAHKFGVNSSGRGVGLVAMEERLNMAGGSFEIHSREQEGTRLSFTIPTLP